MLTFKNRRGQLHKMNTALVALTVVYVAGAAAVISAPYWGYSIPALAPLAAFAATPLGIGVLAAVAVALVGLAIYTISKNNKISELEAKKIVVDGDKVKLQVTRKELEHIKENNKNEDKDGKVVEGEYRIDFTNPEGKECYVIVTSEKSQEIGDAVFLSIKSQVVKNDRGGALVGESELLKMLGLGTGEKDAKVFNTYLKKAIITQVASQEQEKQAV
ncbi:hypothetical protein [Wolbachia pipientis]|uniref:hypothetical protein n=1 Tax=Wolbachia pipientis TaxID=955 RepID=UPI0025A44E18|nr:hypothetical protein [Wolbachia pipientis]MDM8334905.1 hypothetical protein [Wolbachia pipientis]